MGNIEFAWDPRKARSNLIKHGIAFTEAQTAFLDENARLIEDPTTLRTRTGSSYSDIASRPAAGLSTIAIESKVR